MKIGFIGLGSMSTAILKGLKNSGKFQMTNVYASARDYNKLVDTCHDLGINPCHSNQECIDAVDIVFLGVKPEDLGSLDINLYNKAIVSMAAKTSFSRLLELFGDRPIIRIMPNLNAAINAGTTAYALHDVNKDLEGHLKDLLDLLGNTWLLDESQFSGFIALAGSAPALIYRFIDALASSVADEGIDKDTALDIVSKTFIGSAQYLSSSNEDPQVLINRVASKGGTTQEGLNVLDSYDFETIIKDSAQAIIDKDKKG